MSKFDYMEFGYSAGNFDQLVLHAKKYTKEQAVEIFNSEYGYKGLKCTVDNIDSGYVKYLSDQINLCHPILTAVVMGLLINQNEAHFPYGLLL